MKTNLTVIIPTLNNFKGIKYLKNYFKNKPYKVIIVDNRKKNLGFAGGINKGAKDVKTKWMLILNDDIEFEVKSEKLKVKSYNSKLKTKNKETIQKLIRLAEENNLDAVTPILVNANGEVENFGYKVLPLGRIELVKNPNYKIQMTNEIQNQKSKIDGMTAACLLVKTEVFRKLKGFDESFFAYLEDVDFFLRLSKLYKPPRFSDGESFPKPRRLSARFAICPEVEVLHNHMTTSKTMGNFKARQDMVNWWRLYFKHKDRFEFNFKFFLERLRNISGFFKASIKNIL